MFGPWFSTSCSLFLLFVLFVGQKNSAWAEKGNLHRCRYSCYARDGFFRDDNLVKPVSVGKLRLAGYWCSCPSSKAFNHYMMKNEMKRPALLRLWKLLRFGYGRFRFGDLRTFTFYSGEDVLAYIKKRRENYGIKHGIDQRKWEEMTAEDEITKLGVDGKSKDLQVDDLPSGVKKYIPKSKFIENKPKKEQLVGVKHLTTQVNPR
ncbi:unnamed protein product [Bemisia tabaci]|uniref:Uncharacterized protein n=1 Tax=Bemisia tabaci TaxID=7038 RepID=A0AAI8UTZ9_BEMTA|nr:unnamed protein product [Bemisia tabaci]